MNYPGLRSHLKKDAVLYPLPNPYPREELILATKIMRMAQGMLPPPKLAERATFNKGISCLSHSNSALVLFANQEVEGSPSIPLQLLPNVLETQTEQKSSLTETPTTKPISLKSSHSLCETWGSHYPGQARGVFHLKTKTITFSR